MKILSDVLSKNYSYIKVGGVIKKLIIIENDDDIKKLNISDFKVIGNGSKILFDFDYTEDTYLLDRNSYIREFEDSVLIGGGTTLNDIGKYFSNNNLASFSKIRTIPGRLGGTICQNASCFDECITDNLIDVTFYSQGKILNLKKEELLFSYRSSFFQQSNNVFILNARFKKIKKDKNILENETRDVINKRKLNQPVDKLTLGSTFKNINPFYAGKILDELNYKGFCLTKGCEVSKKHCNFIEIKKDCSSYEISLLINTLKGVLYKKTGIKFPLEIIIFRR